MHTTKKAGVTIGLIAGQGSLPHSLISRWEQQGLTPVIVGLKGITDPSLYQGKISAEFSIGQVGHILNFFKSHGVSQLVMIGGLKRPNLWTVIPDMGGVTILARLLLRQMKPFGDDSLLRFVRHEIEKYGIQVVAVHDYMPELLCPLGVLTKTAPSPDDIKTIEMGFKAAKQHGADDKGQSIVVNESGVCGFEGKDGTNALIHSCRGQKDAILVKASKPQQDLALDMPTIGAATIEHILKAGFKGIAVEAGKTMIIDQEKIISLCDKNGIFLVGLKG